MMDQHDVWNCQEPTLVIQNGEKHLYRLILEKNTQGEHIIIEKEVTEAFDLEEMNTLEGIEFPSNQAEGEIYIYLILLNLMADPE